MTPTSRALLAGMLGLGLVACSSAAAREPEYRDADRWPFGNRALDRTLVAGTLIEATIHGPFAWRRNKAGAPLTATVSADVKNAHGWVVIPAGCPVGLRIALRGSPASTLLDVTSVTVWGQVYPVSATVALQPVAGAGGTRILFILPEGLTVERRPGEAHQGLVAVSPASK
jgi:hypothetical protein